MGEAERACCARCREDAQVNLGTAKRPVLIVFDLDGTIADSRILARESYKRVFALLGYGTITDEQADAFNGPDADEICRVMGVGSDKRPLYDQLIAQTDAEFVRTIGKLFPGVPEMLQELSQHACLAILTNGCVEYCDANIEVFSLSPYISLHSGYVSGVTKAQRIRQWARELDARRVICVGDRGTDIQHARDAGAFAIGVTYGMGSREELSGADALCDTPQEVARVCRETIALS